METRQVVQSRRQKAPARAVKRLGSVLGLLATAALLARPAQGAVPPRSSQVASQSEVTTNTPRLVTPGVLVDSIGAGEIHTCEVKTDGSVACWGRNVYGQSSPPAGIFTQVTGGAYHTCGKRSNGTLACWGRDLHGVTTPPSGTFTQVSAGFSYTCGVRTDGTVACWGYDAYGEATPPRGTFTQVSGGTNHSCGVRTEGTVACWGQDVEGAATPPSGTFTQVSAGGWFSCGVRADSTLACWGSNYQGKATPPSGTFAQVTTGENHSCGIRTDGRLACWGSNSDGRATPPSGTFTQIDAGEKHTCGVRTDGTVACWGSNTVGQAPRPTIDPSSLPHTFVGLRYGQLLSGSGGAAPYGFDLVAGGPPPGLTLSTGGGLAGTPTTTGTYTFTVRAIDDHVISKQQPYTIAIMSTRVCSPTKSAANPVLSIGTDGSWDDGDVWSPAVLKEGSTYLMWYAGDDGASSSRIGLVTSTNGITWTRHISNPVLSPIESWEGNGIVAGSVMSDSGLYKMWYTGFDSGGVGSIGYATSADGVTWAKYGGNPVLSLGAAGSWDDSDVMHPTVIKEGSTYHMWYTGNDGIAARIGHATSSDGMNWTRGPANHVLELGAPGDWDWLDVYAPSVVTYGGEYVLWYSGHTLPPTWQTGYGVSSDGSNWARGGMLIPEGAPGTFDVGSADYPSVMLDGTAFKVWYSGVDEAGTYSIGYATAEECGGAPAFSNTVFLPIVMCAEARPSCAAYYTDDFGDPGSGWPVRDDSNVTYAYTGGQYQIWVKQASRVGAVTPGAKATDFTAAVSARRTTGSSGGYGIVFGINEDWTEYYEFSVEMDYYSIWKYDSGWFVVQDPTRSGYINAGTGWNRLKVIRNGSSIAVYVNDHHLATATDSSFTGLRRIGLTAYSPSGGSVDARLDDFALYPADCGVIAAGVGFGMGRAEIHGGPVPPRRER